MNKKEIQKRILDKNNKPLSLDKFLWYEKNNLIITHESELVFNFKDINGINYMCGGFCTFNTGKFCTFNTGHYCTFKTGSDCTFKTYRGCIFDVNDSCSFNVDRICYFINKNNDDSIIIIRDLDNTKVYNSNDLPKNKFLMLTTENIIEKDIKDVNFIDDNIYVLLTQKHKINDFYTYKAIHIFDYFNDNTKTYTIAEKTINNKIYYSHGINLKNAMEDLYFKIARKNSSLKDIAINIKNNNSVITWYDYRLITRSCKLGTLNWLKDNNLTKEDTFNIHNFVEKYKNDNFYGLDKFLEFYYKEF